MTCKGNFRENDFAEFLLCLYFFFNSGTLSTLTQLKDSEIFFEENGNEVSKIVLNIFVNISHRNELTEAATKKKLFLRTSQYSQESACVGVSF